VDIAPPDDSVDTNRVIVTGSGTISSLGLACGALTRAQYLNDPDDVASTSDVMTVTKDVAFQPTPGQTITLHHNPPFLSLLGGVDHAIAVNSFGTYQSDPSGNWQETGFASGDAAPYHGGSLVSLAYYSSSQTITIPVGAARAWVRMWGGSGATGAGGQVSGANAPAGSGAGGYLEKFLTGLTPGHTLTYTRGNGGVVTGGNGQAGTASTLASGTQTIAALTANGSAGTPAASTAQNIWMQGGKGGTATGGDVNRTGQSGSNVVPFWTDLGQGQGLQFYYAWGGAGGMTEFSAGVDGTTNPAGNPGNPGGLIVAWFGDYK
jgi:hypothetical protein